MARTFYWDNLTAPTGTLTASAFDSGGTAIGSATDAVQIAGTQYKASITGVGDSDGGYVVWKDAATVLKGGLVPFEAAVGSRLATSGYTAPDNTSIAAIKAKTDNLPASPAATGDAMVASNMRGTDDALPAASYTAPPSAASIADAVWSAASRTLTSFGTLVADVWAYATRKITGYVTGQSPGEQVLANTTKVDGAKIDAKISGVAASVWSATPRTLTGFGSLVNDTAAAVMAKIAALRGAAQPRPYPKVSFMPGAIVIPDAPDMLEDGSYIDPNTSAAIGTSGHPYYSSDGGTTWHILPQTYTANLVTAAANAGGDMVQDNVAPFTITWRQVDPYDGITNNDWSGPWTGDGLTDATFLYLDLVTNGDGHRWHAGAWKHSAGECDAYKDAGANPAGIYGQFDIPYPDIQKIVSLSISQAAT